MMEELEALLRREPLLEALKTGVMKVVVYPGKMLEAFLIAFGEGVGKGAVGMMYGA